MTTKEILNHIDAYIKSKGCHFERGIVENLFLCLKSKPFVILTGAHGCGKYTLTRLFAESIGANKDNGRFKFISVGSGKHDSKFLLGCKNTEGKFLPGELTNIWKRALCDSENPYFVFLDNINSSRPEEFMTEIFKTLDTRYRDEDGNMVSEYLFDDSFFENDYDRENYRALSYPENLYIVASVSCGGGNVFPGLQISDRCFAIEIANELSCIFHPKSSGIILKPVCADNSFLKTQYLDLSECVQREFIELAGSKILEINKIIKYTDSVISYRTRNEMMFYLLLCNKYEIFDEDKAMDMVIMQRILPRISGSSVYIKTALSLIFKLCVTEGSQDYSSSSFKMFRALSGRSVRYSCSANKITRMTRTYEENNCCSYLD